MLPTQVSEVIVRLLLADESHIAYRVEREALRQAQVPLAQRDFF